MIWYLDTSVLVAATTNEAKSGSVQIWLAGQTANDLAISDWAVTEYSSAHSFKLRTRQIGTASRNAAASLFAGLCANSLTTLPINPSHFRDAARFAEQHRLALRGGDALHLAVTAAYGARLCTLDKGFANAAAAIGIATLLL